MFFPFLAASIRAIFALYSLVIVSSNSKKVFLLITLVSNILRSAENVLIHKSYLIKDVKKILEDKKIYDEISTERKKNFIRIGDGRASIPDIVCKSGNARFYYEVECGTHKQLDFNEKCNKLSMLTREIIIVGQNRQIVGGILKRQVETWIAKEWASLAPKDVEVYLTTISDLKNDNWTYCYDMDTSEPRCNCPIDRHKKGGDSL